MTFGFGGQHSIHLSYGRKTNLFFRLYRCTNQRRLRDAQHSPSRNREGPGQRIAHLDPGKGRGRKYSAFGQKRLCGRGIWHAVGHEMLVSATLAPAQSRCRLLPNQTCPI